MSKSVYSVVLNDEIVELIDKKAFLSGSSRSQMINEILAEAVGFSTEKQQIAEIMDVIGALEIGRLKVVRRQQSVIDFLSALNYKYSPKVTYSVDLFAGEGYGELKIALRTTNPELLNITGNFFNDFIELEKLRDNTVQFGVRDGKLIRRLGFSKTNFGKDLAEKISTYVGCLDKLFNEYVFDYNYGTEREKLKENYNALADKMKI